MALYLNKNTTSFCIESQWDVKALDSQLKNQLRSSSSLEEKIKTVGSLLNSFVNNPKFSTIASEISAYTTKINVNCKDLKKLSHIVNQILSYLHSIVKPHPKASLFSQACSNNWFQLLNRLLSQKTINPEHVLPTDFFDVLVQNKITRLFLTKFSKACRNGQEYLIKALMTDVNFCLIHSQGIIPPAFHATAMGHLYETTKLKILNDLIQNGADPLLRFRIQIGNSENEYWWLSQPIILLNLGKTLKEAYYLTRIFPHFNASIIVNKTIQYTIIDSIFHCTVYLNNTNRSFHQDDFNPLRNWVKVLVYHHISFEYIATQLTDQSNVPNRDSYELLEIAEQAKLFRIETTEYLKKRIELQSYISFESYKKAIRNLSLDDDHLLNLITSYVYNPDLWTIKFIAKHCFEREIAIENEIAEKERAQKEKIQYEENLKTLEVEEASSEEFNKSSDELLV